MKNKERTTYYLLKTITIAGVALFVSQAPRVAPAEAIVPNAKLKANQAVQAKELLGMDWSKSLKRSRTLASHVPTQYGPQPLEPTHLLAVVPKLKKSILTNYKALPKKPIASSEVRRISNIIIAESLKYDFDPFFVVAVILNESSFNPRARGQFGEIGLMQIKPSSAAWIAKKYQIPWKGAESLVDPVENIRIGSAYLDYLRVKFKKSGHLYLAAYNMGSLNVRRLLKKNKIPKIYSDAVKKRYAKLLASY
jgi:soluble lytic murein transglycosylase-like protein